MKTPPRKSRLQVWKYLNVWDVSSLQRRNEIVDQFIQDYTTIDPIDTDQLFTRAGGLIFTRFTVGMQLAFARRKPVAHYFQALGIFVKSLQGERYIVEFTLMGALISTFEVLRVDEMKDKDKSHVFQFLIRMIEGCGGTRVKEFICRDNSYLESVVDCLTMCKKRTVIHHARLFLQNMCQGNTMTNICMVSKYVISLLSCDFNPRVQALACRVLPTIIHQNAEIATNCYSQVVDALKTDYNDMLVDIGELCLVIMDTPDGDALLKALMVAALPANVSEDLENCKGSSNMAVQAPTIVASRSIHKKQERVESLVAQEDDEDNVKSNYVTHDTYFRQQYGALVTLSFMLKNNPNLADWMVEKGIVGSALAAIGTAPYPENQLAGVRLLLLVYELSPACAAAIILLLPKNLLVILLSEVEDALQYLTAPMCMALRKIGRAVQGNWQEWFDEIVLSTTTTHFHSIPSSKISSSLVNQKITNDCQTLAELTGEGLFTIADNMAILYLDEYYRDYILTKTGTGTTTKSFTSMAKLTAPQPQAGVAQIQANPSLEGFRKYLIKVDPTNSQLEEEDFDKGQSYHFNFNVDADETLDGTSLTSLEVAMLEDALRAMEEDQEGDQVTEEGEENFEGQGELVLASDGPMSMEVTKNEMTHDHE